MSTAVNHSTDEGGIGWIVLDDPDSRGNLLGPRTQAALRAALDALAARSPRAVVVTSARDRIFVAGADLKWLAALPDEAAAAAASRDGQQLFELIARFAVPVVCAIQGACAGGGYELALACHWRIAADTRETVIGLPEVGLGLIPGWGGTVRLTRLLGARAAADHILRAALVPAAAALSAGLVDEVVPAGELKERARAAALRLAAGGVPARPAPPAVEPGYFAAQRAALAGRSRAPAALAALDAIEAAALRPPAEALAVEAGRFGAAVASPAARNLVHGFFLRERLKKGTVDAWRPPVPGEAATLPPLRRVGVIGAGTMGSAITHWCAARGIGVLLNDVDSTALRQAVQNVRELFREDEKRGLTTAAAAHKAIGGIGISTDLQDFDFCDIVIEAAVENIAVKRKIFADLAKCLRPDCVIASNSSALPIEEIAAGIAHPGRAIGLHFFHPVARMPLVEVILGSATTRDTARRTFAFARELEKFPVICRSSPGLFLTRVLFFYLNEACRLWEQGVAVETLDRAMRDWGWPMGPMRLIDEVGVDITDFIFAELAQFFPGRFIPSTICHRMLSAGWRGRKNGAGAGFYAYDGEVRPNPELAPLAPPPDPGIDGAAVQAELAEVLRAETERVLAEGIVKTADEADAALVLGAGFPAFRGGLLRGARAVAGRTA